MIHKYIRDLLAEEIPELIWTDKYFFDPDNTGTVYIENGDDPYGLDKSTFYPSYGVLIRSSDWNGAEAYAMTVSRTLHNLKDDFIEVTWNRNGKPYLKSQYQLLILEQSGDIMDLGIVEDNINEIKVNFDAKIIKLKEVYINGESN